MKVERQRFTFWQARRTVPITFSIMLAQASERPQLLRQSKPSDSKNLVDAFQDRAGDPGPVSFETLGEIADQLFGLVGVIQLPCLSQHAPHRSVQRFGQPLHNVAGLVDLTALDRRGASK